MRAIIILAAIAFTHGAKLERTYLPPSNARTAGGSDFLETPRSGASGSNSPGRNNNAQPSFSQAGLSIYQIGNDLPRSGNGLVQPGNGLFRSGNGFSQSGIGFLQSDNGVIQAQYGNLNDFNGGSERRGNSFERNAAILRQDSENNGDVFSYVFETENGISADESGVATDGVEAQGGFSYTGDDGQVYSVRYSAGKNGFLPQGDHFPTPPPVPEEILKALEQNARDEAAGIYDDGKYAGSDNNNNNQYNYQQNNALNGNDDDTVVTNSALARSGNNALSNGRYNAQNGAVAPTFGARNSQNAPTFNAGPSSIYGAPAENAPAGIPRSSPENAYLPPFAGRGQARNVFGSRQQSFDATTGYKY